MIVFSDFDGTLTLDGKVTREFFDIIELLQKQKSELIIVSGRSLSWGHFLLTHFPLETCIMEGGGVIVRKNSRGEIEHQALVSENELHYLETFTKKLQVQFPNLPLSSDSFGRLSDRAIEFQMMSHDFVNDVTTFMSQNEINYSKSNVHINFWRGQISKFLGVKQFIHQHRSHEKMDDHWFFGDAPNDESMFELFPNSVGVSNIAHCLDRLTYKPRIILTGEENIGAKGVLAHLKTILNS